MDNQNNRFSEYKLRSRNRFTTIVCCISILFIVAFVWMAHMNIIPSFVDFFPEIFSSLLGGAIVICINMWVSGKEKEAHDREVAKLLFDTLQGSNNELISKFYSKKAIDQVVNNCLSHYCDQLAMPHFEYIESNVKSFRNKLYYYVKVSDSGLIDTSSNRKFYRIAQSISYQRFFRTSDKNSTFKFRCFFAFSDKSLEKRLNQNDYFFREVIVDPKVISELRNLNAKDHKKEIFELLDLKLYLNDLKMPCQKEEINVLFTHEDPENPESEIDGILFEVIIPKSQIDITPADSKSTEIKTGDTDFYVSYEGKVEFTLNMHNCLYVIFAEPCINPRLVVQVSHKLFKQVQYISCLSIPRKDGATQSAPLLTDSVSNTFKLELPSKSAVFPRSGIYFNW